MFVRLRWSVPPVAALIALCTVTQAQLSKPGMGTVTGHVICQDTQRPARFAQVLVIAVPSSVTATPRLDPTDPKSAQAYGKAIGDVMSTTTFVLAQTAFDGSFVVEDVLPGEYYVMASVAGYVQPIELVQAAYDAGGDLTKGIPGIADVRVAADRAVNADLAVTRGAAIEGHVLWDDGAPVDGAIVTAEPKIGEHKSLPAQFSMVRMSGVSLGNTDDRGHYRIAGLQPGDYTVKVTLHTNQRMSLNRGRLDQVGALFGTVPLVVYAPGGFRKTDAKPVTLGNGEERTDEDITFNLSATHTVSGRVTSAEDHHGLDRGVVTLTDTGDKTFRRSAGLDADGNYKITFVPSGTYTMTVKDAADTVPDTPKPDEGLSIVGFKTLRTYQDAEQQVLVPDDDLTGQNIELKPSKPSTADADSSSENTQ